MPAPRIFTRPQALLRGFFGLGPAQVETEDIVRPMIDIEHLLRSNEDVQLFTGLSGAVAPGVAGGVTITVPAGDGPWLLHAVAVSSTGPATSGSFRMSAHFILNTWGAGLTGFFGVFDSDPLSIADMGGEQVVRGVWFDKPVILYRVNPFADSVRGTILNDAASVGTAAVTLAVLMRQLEPV